MNRSYFDYNASHPPFPDILQNKLKEYLSNYCNPSGPSRYSLERQNVIEKTRAVLAHLCKKEASGFVFSSSGTEANYFLVHCLKHSPCFTNKLIVSPFEHPSVYAALESYNIEAIIPPAYKDGSFSLDFIEDTLKQSRVPLFLIYASNETGFIPDWNSIYQLASRYEVPIFSDTAQAFAKLPVAYESLSGFSFSGHKIGAGMGVSGTYLSASFLKEGLAIFSGGNQENRHRAGTENSFAIHCLQEVALKYESERDLILKRLEKYQQQIETKLTRLGGIVIGKGKDRLASTSLCILPIEDIDFFMMGLEAKGIIISNGSSCKSRSREASPALLRMGFKKEEALRAIRISTGYFTNQEEVELLLEESENLIQKLN